MHLGDGGTTGSLGGTGDVTNDGELVFDKQGTYSFSRNIIGSGDVTFNETNATVTISGDNEYTGDTTIKGTVILTSSNGLGDNGASPNDTIIHTSLSDPKPASLYLDNASGLIINDDFFTTGTGGGTGDGGGADDASDGLLDLFDDYPDENPRGGHPPGRVSAGRVSPGRR